MNAPMLEAQLPGAPLFQGSWKAACSPAVRVVGVTWGMAGLDLRGRVCLV